MILLNWKQNFWSVLNKEAVKLILIFLKMDKWQKVAGEYYHTLLPLWVTLNTACDSQSTLENWCIQLQCTLHIIICSYEHTCKILVPLWYFYQISKKDVDSFKPGKCVSKCELIVIWDPKQKDQKPERLLHKINLKGASELCNYFHLKLDPAWSNSMSLQWLFLLAFLITLPFLCFQADCSSPHIKYFHISGIITLVYHPK